MQDWMRIEVYEQRLEARLNESVKYDDFIMDRIVHDKHCLPCQLHQQQLSYRLDGHISLEQVFRQISFEHRQGYQFLLRFFEQLLATNANKPLLYDLQYMYTDSNGQDFWFVGVPIKVENWLYQQEPARQFIEALGNGFQTKTCFEIKGYLLSLSSSDEANFQVAYEGLKQLYQIYYPVRWYHRKPKPFCFEQSIVAEPVHIQTQVLAWFDQPQAELICDSLHYPLQGENWIIGRSSSADIVIEHAWISLHHAKITYENERYYLQDLKSSNGTYLNDKKVVRKMRLRDGMVIQLGQSKLNFHAL